MLAGIILWRITQKLKLMNINLVVINIDKITDDVSNAPPTSKIMP